MVSVILLRDKLRGQAAIVIALSMLLLVVIVGLAIDGGSMFNQRRTAQNSSDAAALAGTREMLTGYDDMILHYAYDVDGSADLDAAINLTITNFANLHGVNRSDLEAYYVNDDKQIVSNQQVGQLGYVPWASAGAKGITVRNKSATNSWFMGIIGWNSVSARASSTAFMGIAVDSARDLKLLPVGIFTDVQHMRNMAVGQTYTLINDNTLTSGNRGYLDFNGEGGSANVNQAWMQCGFNPTILTPQDWQDFCAAQAGVGHTEGPALMYQCLNPNTDPDCTRPDMTTPLHIPYVKYGPGTDGWWLTGSSGTTRSSCEALAQYVTTNGDYMVPMFDWTTGSGSGTLFHLIAIAMFHIDDVNIDCHYNPPTPTPDPSATPCSGGGCPGSTESQSWYIQGTLVGFYSTGTGRHGDIRHTSARIVFLDN